jgi:O-antigen/teichoic acid export membrane protein
MAIVAAFFVNAALNFALGLLVAKFLGPSDFGRYAVGMAAAVVLNTLCFEWLRLSTTRFYSQARRAGEPGIRATLELGYGATALVLAALTLAAFLADVEIGLSASLLAGAVAAGIGMGVFDYRAALARALFLERAYAQLVLLKNAAAFALMVGAAYLFGEPAFVLAGAAISAGAAIFVARRELADAGPEPTRAEGRHLRLFASYALPLVAANLVYQLVSLMNRSALALIDSYAEAGRFALAADLGLRIFMTLGSGLDILLFQMAVRREETHGRAAAEAQIVRNFAVVIALLLPVAGGYWLVLPSLEALVVPQAYRGAFADYTVILIPALFAFALIQYGLNPVFQLRQRTGPVVFAALAALCINAALLPVLLPTVGGKGVALAQLAGFALATVIIGVLAGRRGGLRVPWRDVGLAGAATGAMLVLLLPLRAIEAPVLALAVMIAAGGAIYGTLAYLLDIAGLRTLLHARFSRPRAIPAPAE